MKLNLKKSKSVIDFFRPLWHYTFRHISDGGCSSGVEHQIVDLAVVGSKPITHPMNASAAGDQPAACVFKQSENLRS